MDKEIVAVINLMESVVKERGVRHGVDTVLGGLVALVEDRQELHQAVSQWCEDNLVLALPPLDGTTDAGCDNSVCSEEQIRAPPRTAGKKAHSTANPRCPPWAAHAGLPIDGSVSTGDEIASFAAFVGATPEEQQARSSMRMSLQKLVQLLVCNNTTLKVIGAWAMGLASFSSPLDLVAETPDSPAAPLLDQIHTCLRDMGVSVEHSVTRGFPCVRLKSDALARAVWGRDTTNSAGFCINIFADGSPLNPRAATTKVASRLNRFPEHKKTAMVIRGIVERTNIGERPGGVGGYLVQLMLLAFLEEFKAHDEFADPGWVLRNFFRFYSTFPFAEHSIVPTASGPSFVGSELTLSPQSLVFCKRTDSGAAQLSILDPLGTGFNIASGVSSLPQLVGTLHYITILIARHDKENRGTALLPNLLTWCDVLWKRLAWLRKGVEITKGLAVSVAQGISDYLTDPATTLAKEELLHSVVWRAGGDTSLKSQLISHAIARPHSPLAHLKSHIPQLVEALDTYRDEPEVQQLYEKCVQRSPTQVFVNAVVREVASCAGGGEGEEALAAKVLERVLQKPETRLLEYRDCVKTVGDKPASHPTVLQLLNSVACQPKVKDLITADTATRIATEAYEVLASVTEEEKQQLVSSALDGGDEWGPAQNFHAIFTMLAFMKQKKPDSIVHSMGKDVLPALCKVLLEFSTFPQVREARRLAVTAAVTKDMVVAIAKDVLRFVSKKENHEFAEMMAHAMSQGDEHLLREAEITILSVISSKPGSRLADFQDRKAVEELKGLMKPFSSAPEVQDIYRQIAVAVFTGCSG